MTFLKMIEEYLELCERYGHVLFVSDTGLQFVPLNAVPHMEDVLIQSILELRDQETK